MPSLHTCGCISNRSWVSLCSSASKGCGRPQEADEQKVDTHVFCYVINGNKDNCPNLGVIGENIKNE